MLEKDLVTSYVIMQTLLHHRALASINPCCTPEPFSHALHFVKRLHLQRLGMISKFLWCLPTTCKPPTQNFNRFRPSMHFLHFFPSKKPKKRPHVTNLSTFVQNRSNLTCTPQISTPRAPQNFSSFRVGRKIDFSKTGLPD